MDSCDWPWWIMFAAEMLFSYFREMRLRRERNDPRCTLFYTYHGRPVKIGCLLPVSAAATIAAAVWQSLVNTAASEASAADAARYLPNVSAEAAVAAAG